jgi:hypothetical protein
MSSSIVRYVNPWKFRREQEGQRLQTLRQRDGDDCRRCRRPMRFDLPSGHDLGPKIEQVMSGAKEALDNLCLTHRRCIGEGADHTAEVRERIRRKNEADLLSRSRKRRAGSAAAA